MKDCKYCESLEKKVKTNEDWDHEHSEHGDKTKAPFPHPSGQWYWMVCPCGAKHLRADGP